MPVQDRVQLSMEALLDVKVLGQHIPGPGEGIRGGFMPRKQEGNAPLTLFLNSHSSSHPLNILLQHCPQCG